MNKNSISKIVIAIYFSIAGTLLLYGQNFVYKSHTNASIATYSMPYRLYVPDGYDPGKTYPLVLFLHGAGERGSDNNAQLTGNRGATLWAETANQAAHPSFVLAPQCPSNGQWVNTPFGNGSYSIDNIPMSKELKMVKDIIETLQTQYSIDASRLYITGLSMGGYGTWDFILRYPTLFKAAIPMCGAGDPSKASQISTLPLWIFHGNQDGAVPVAGSRDMVNAINALGFNNREPFYTEYDKDHVSAYETAFTEPNLVDWMFTANPVKLGLTDITDQAGTITALGDNQPDGLKDYAFDNSVNTSWLDLANANPATRASWIQYKLSENSYVVTEYTITSASNAPERDPKNWELLGSNNGSEWTTLDTRTNEVFSERLQKKSYTFTNAAAYTYYRLRISSVNNPATATGVQLAELEILGIPAVRSVNVLPGVLNLDLKDTKQLYAAVVPSNATPTITWSSTNDEVATVSSTGLVTAIGAGKAEIIATAANNNKTGRCSVTVSNTGYVKFEAENATLNGLNISTDQAAFSGTGFAAPFGNAGNYIEFTVTGVEAGRHDIIVRYATGSGCPLNLIVNGVLIGETYMNNTGTWGNWTNHVDYATLTAGTNTIRYQKTSGGSWLNMDYISITVKTPIAVTGVEVSPGTADVIINATKQLTATVSPQDAKNTTVIWSSSNAAIAEVSPNGLVLANALGSATITATTQDGGYVSSCVITVVPDPSANFNVTYTEGNGGYATVSNTDLFQTSVSGRTTSGGYFYDNLNLFTDGNSQVQNFVHTGSSITYTLDTSTNTSGYDITGIDVFTRWADAGRVNPNVSVSYSLVTSPDDFVSLTTLKFTQTVGGSEIWTKSSVSAGGAKFRGGVAKLKFDFGNQQNDFVGYSEIDVFGVPALLGGTKNIESNVSIYGANNNIVVDLSSQDGSSIITVVDTRGSVVKSIQSNGYGLLNINMPANGIYMVLVQNGDKLSSQKVILN